jgi:sulfite exporter TauE/SafE
LDLFAKLPLLSPWLIPGAFLLLGLSSSLHCAGMCGPLSLLAAHGRESSWLYQLGRLTGYLSIGIVLSFVGQTALKVLLLSFGGAFWYFLLAMLIASLAALVFSTRKVAVPKILERCLRQLMTLAQGRKSQAGRAFLIGLSSVFLPCGVLYLTLISLVALSNPWIAGLGILFFWMGTVPLLHFGLPWLRKRLERFSIKVSQLNALIVVLLCALVLLHRFPTLGEEIARHCGLR